MMMLATLGGSWLRGVYLNNGHLGHWPSLGRHYAQMVRVAVDNCSVDTDANQPRPEKEEKPDSVLIRVSV